MSARAIRLVVPAQMVKLAISLLLQIMIARLLMPEGRGVYALCIAISTALMLLTFFGNEFGIRYLLATNKIDIERAFQYLLCISLLSFSISVFVSLLLHNSALIDFGGSSPAILILACLFSFGQLLTTQINVFLTIRGHYLQASFLAVIDEFLKLVVAAALLYKHPTVTSALLATIIGNAIITSFCVLRFNLYRSVLTTPNMSDLSFIYKFGLRSFWFNLSNLSNAHMGTLALAGLMTNAQLGIYNLAFGLIARAQVLPDALNRVLVPESMASDDRGRQFRMIQISVTGLLALSLVIVVILGVFNQSLMTLLFGIEYREVGPVAFLLFLGFMLKLMVKPLEAYFNEIAGKPGIIAIIQVVGITMMAMLTYLGAAFFGLSGAAIGSAAAMFLSSSAIILAYTRSTGRPVTALINLKALGEGLGKLRAGRN